MNLDGSIDDLTRNFIKFHNNHPYYLNHGDTEKHRAPNIRRDRTSVFLRQVAMADNDAASTASATLASTGLVRVAVSNAFDPNFAAIVILARDRIGSKCQARSNVAQHEP